MKRREQGLRIGRPLLEDLVRVEPPNQQVFVLVGCEAILTGRDHVVGLEEVNLQIGRAHV